MLDTLTLLKETPHVAIIRMLNAVNNSTVQARLVQTSGIQLIQGLTTNVMIRTLSTDPYDYAGETLFTFERLSLNDAFEGTEFYIRVPLPTLTSVLVAEVFNALGWQYDSDDFIEEVITASPYVLKAAATSRRWVGFVEIPILQ